MTRKEKSHYPPFGFPERLTQQMQTMKMAPEMLANLIGIDTKRIVAYMNGQSIPDITILGQISKHLKVSTDWLIFGMKKNGEL